MEPGAGPEARTQAVTALFAADMKQIAADPGLVAYCGLYCGSCRSYLNEKCPGCHDNAKAAWCQIRSCCREQQTRSCAECRDHGRPEDCGKFNNLMARLFGLVFRSDRAACIRQIRELGLAGHAQAMARDKKHTIKKRF
jgi:hypothetical protein